MGLIQVGNQVIDTAKIDYVDLHLEEGLPSVGNPLIIYFSSPHQLKFVGDEAEALRKYFTEESEEVKLETGE